MRLAKPSRVSSEIDAALRGSLSAVSRSSRCVAKMRDDGLECFAHQALAVQVVGEQVADFRQSPVAGLADHPAPVLVQEVVALQGFAAGERGGRSWEVASGWLLVAREKSGTLFTRPATDN